MKKDKTIYFLLAAAAAYYAYKWWKGKQTPAAVIIEQPANNVVIPGQAVTVVESLQNLVDQTKEIKPLIETASTYQTFYGQIQGMAPKKVPYSC